MSQSSSQSDAKGGGQHGTCPTCFRSDIRVTVGGLLYNHGPRGGHCGGVGRAPLATYLGIHGRRGSLIGARNLSLITNLSLPTSTPVGTLGGIMAVGGSVPSGSQVTSSSQSPLVGPHPTADTDLKPTIDSLTKLFGNQIPIVKWIPGAARQQCAILLSKLPSTVVHKPQSIEAWADLLSFAKRILFKPQRGGIHRNLGNIITRCCRDFHTVSILQAVEGHEGLAPTTSQRRQRRGRQKKTGGGEGDALTKAVSAKLEEGNYKGAVRLVCSDETHAPASRATLLALRTKHPTAPADHRVVSGPSPLVSSTKFDESSVRSATLSFPASSSAGPDGLTPLTPQHLRDLIMIEGGSGPLLSVLTGL